MSSSYWNISYSIHQSFFESIDYSLENYDQGTWSSGYWYQYTEGTGEVYCSELSNPIELENCTSVDSMNE